MAASANTSSGSDLVWSSCNHFSYHSHLLTSVAGWQNHVGWYYISAKYVPSNKAFNVWTLTSFIVSLVLFLCLATEYMTRYVRDQPFYRPQATSSADTYLDKNVRFEWDTRIKILVGGLSFICVCIFIRYVLPSHTRKIFYLPALDPFIVWSNSLTAGTAVSSKLKFTSVRITFYLRAVYCLRTSVRRIGRCYGPCGIVYVQHLSSRVPLAASSCEPRKHVIRNERRA